MQVTLDSNTTNNGFDLYVSGVPTEKAAQLQSDVTALVFGFDKETTVATVAPEITEDVLERFLRSMVGQLTGKISAIKAVRCLAPSIGLYDAKNFVERVERTYGISFNAVRRQF